MVDPAILQELLEKQPFEPFRIRMADGLAYEVTNLDLVVTMDSMLFIALPGDRFKFLSYVNMTSVENGVPRRRRRAQR